MLIEGQRFHHENDTTGVWAPLPAFYSLTGSAGSRLPQTSETGYFTAVVSNCQILVPLAQQHLKGIRALLDTAVLLRFHIHKNISTVLCENSVISGVR